MSASTAVRLPSGTAPHPVLAVAAIETRRLLRHPVFVLGLALFAWQYTAAVLVSPEGSLRGLSEAWAVMVGFFLGLAGFVAMHRITRSTGRSRDVVDAVPLDEPSRTLALCLTALVPFAVALGSGVVAWLVWDPSVPANPARDYTTLTRSEIWSFHATVLLAALGGPLLGIAVARWWRWPMAGTVTAVGLVAWSVSTGMSTTNLALTVHHLAGPFTLMLTGAESEETYRQAGSWVWHVAYIACLCALAALAALLHGATGRRRTLILRVGWTTAGVALVLLALSATTGPDGVLLWTAP
jgi:hypothetical protein